MLKSESLSRILLTPGEPAGVGPDITIKLVQKRYPAQLVTIADPDLLKARAKLLGLPLTLHECDLDAPKKPLPAQHLNIIPIKCLEKVTAGTLNIANAAYVIATLETAAKLCLAQKANAVVTGPVQKSVMNDAGINFSGHTEFFAELSNVEKTVMLFVVGQKLKVALASTHLPLAKVPAAITKTLLQETLRVLIAGLKTQFKMSAPKIFVCGLNPHAGESGHLGREEIETIAPVIKMFKAGGEHVEGPFPADTIFTSKYLSTADAILAMYHDQALPVVKFAGFGDAVNVTLGLPFIRTSVDHGTALDVAGTNKADAKSLASALTLAIQLCRA